MSIKINSRIKQVVQWKMAHWIDQSQLMYWLIKNNKMGYSKAYLHDPCPSVMKEQLRTLSISFFKFTFFKLTGMGNLRWKK